MKRFGKLMMALLAVVVLLAGCTMKGDYKLKIDKEKKVSISMTVAYDKEFVDGMIQLNGGQDSNEVTDEARWAMIDKNEGESYAGYEKTKYEADGWYGYVYTKELGTLDEISTDDKNAARVELTSENITSSKIFIKDGDTYKSLLKLSDKDKDQMTNYTGYGALFDVKFTVELPVKATSNNATEVTNDGKLLTWNLLDTSEINFEFEYNEDAYNNTKIYIAILISVIFIVIIGTVLILRLVNKGNKPTETKTVVKEVKEEPKTEEVKEEAKEEPKTEEVKETKVEEKVVEEKLKAAKKTTTKKAEPKKETVKKVSTKKATAEKKETPKKTVAKKESAPKKTVAKKTTEKKPATKKTTTKKSSK